MKNKIKDLETLLNESKLDQEMRNILEELNEESELSTNDAPKVVEEGEPEEKSLHANNSDIEDMNDEEKTEDVDEVVVESSKAQLKWANEIMNSENPSPEDLAKATGILGKQEAGERAAKYKAIGKKMEEEHPGNNTYKKFADHSNDAANANIRTGQVYNRMVKTIDEMKDGAKVMTEELKVNDAPEVVKPEAEEPKPVEATNADIEKMNDEEKTEDVKEVVVEEVNSGDKQDNSPIPTQSEGDKKPEPGSPSEGSLNNDTKEVKPPVYTGDNLYVQRQNFKARKDYEEKYHTNDPIKHESEDPVLEDVVEPVTPEVETAEAKGYGDGEVVEHTHEVCPVCGKCKCKPGECECPEDERCKCEEVENPNEQEGVIDVNKELESVEQSLKEMFNLLTEEELSTNDAPKVVGGENPDEKAFSANNKDIEDMNDEKYADDVEEVLVESFSDYQLMQILEASGYEPSMENVSILRENEYIVLDEGKKLRRALAGALLATSLFGANVSNTHKDVANIKTTYNTAVNDARNKYNSDVADINTSYVYDPKNVSKEEGDTLDSEKNHELDKAKNRFDISIKAAENDKNKNLTKTYAKSIANTAGPLGIAAAGQAAVKALDKRDEEDKNRREGRGNGQTQQTNESYNYAPKVVGGENPDEKAFSANNKDIEDMNDEKYADDVEEVLVESIDANIKLFEILDECGYDLTSDNYNTLRTAILNRNTLNESVLLEELTRNDSPDVVSTKDPVEAIWKLNNKDLFPQDMSADDVEEVLVEMEEMYSDYEFLTSMEDDEIDGFVESLNYDDAKYYESLLENESIELFECVRDLNSINRLSIYNEAIYGNITEILKEAGEEAATGNFVDGVISAASAIGGVGKKFRKKVGFYAKSGAEKVKGLLDGAKQSETLGKVAGYGIPAVALATVVSKAVQAVRKHNARKKYGQKLVDAMKEKAKTITDANKKAKFEDNIKNVEEYVKSAKTRRQERRKTKAELRAKHTNTKTGKFDKEKYKEDLRQYKKDIKARRKSGKIITKSKMGTEEDKDRTFGREVLDTLNPFSTKETRVGLDKDRKVDVTDKDVENLTNEAFELLSSVSEILIENEIPVNYDTVIDMLCFLEENDYLEVQDCTLNESIEISNLEELENYLILVSESENLSYAKLSLLEAVLDDSRLYELLSEASYRRFIKKMNKIGSKDSDSAESERSKFWDDNTRGSYGKNKITKTNAYGAKYDGDDGVTLNKKGDETSITTHKDTIRKHLDAMKNNAKNMDYGKRHKTLTRVAMLNKAKERQAKGEKYGFFERAKDKIAGRLGWGKGIGAQVRDGIESYKTAQSEHKDKIKEARKELKKLTKKYKSENKKARKSKSIVNKLDDTQTTEVTDNNGNVTTQGTDNTVGGTVNNGTVTYTESINLDWMYYDTFEKLDTLSEQVAFTIANDNNDRLFEELVEATAKANRLYEAVLNKYFEVGQERAISILEELAANDAPEVVEEGKPEEKSFSATNADIKKFNDEEDSDDVEEVIVKESIMEFLKESEYEESEENVSLIESAMRGEIVLDEGIINNIIKKSLIKKYATLKNLYDMETDLEKKDRLYEKLANLERKMLKHGLNPGYSVSLTEEELSTNDSPKVAEEGKPEEKAFSADNKDIEKMNSEKKSDDVEEVIVENKVRVAKTPSETSYR